MAKSFRIAVEGRTHLEQFIVIWFRLQVAAILDGLLKGGGFGCERHQYW